MVRVLAKAEDEEKTHKQSDVVHREGPLRSRQKKHKWNRGKGSHEWTKR